MKTHSISLALVFAGLAPLPARADGTAQTLLSVGWGLAHISSADDVVLLKTGSYAAPATISTPCTLRSARGLVTLTR